uniref:Uncharacterized protein n=1 Tax=Chromera velia CCMP2878 TaxID=1169474 RepID=A0A0G4G1M0_9ALVE|eukprot:Cvel_19823.t1-p1 / transcript=Cvel_19823.t1 / gene=Cvel_19823 / organism=Chromera_velia_CCMP2878 / gene_product=hypothetical protein / transcript_product=hypothetical protein / location=Cvel_scaffold1735:15671-16018(-) / protein_length=116 / sequence_SO=supercontig / SO=protein_coding / is_pseudo=false
MGRFLPTKWTGVNTYITGSKNIYDKSVIYIGKTELEPVDPALPPKEVSGDELKQLPVTHPHRQLKGDNGKKVREEFQAKITQRFEERRERDREERDGGHWSRNDGGFERRDQSRGR